MGLVCGKNRMEILECLAHKGAGAKLMFLVPFIDCTIMDTTAQDLFFFKLFVFTVISGTVLLFL